MNTLIEKINYNYLAVTAMFIVFAFYYNAMQPINKYNGGIGNEDGARYYRMAEQFKNGDTFQENTPFVNRILMPAIVGTYCKLFNADILKTYFWLNLFLIYTTCLLLYYYWRSLLGVFLFLIPFCSPMRWLFFYPIMVDYLFYTLMVLGLVLIKKEKYEYLMLVSFLIVLTRGVGMILPIIALRKTIYPLLTGLAAYGITKLVVIETGEYTFINAVVSSLDNLRLAGYVNSVLIVYGVFLAFIKFELEWYEKYFLMIIIMLSIIGGVNTVRYLFWAYPVVMLMILKGLRGIKPAAIAFILLVQIYFARLFEGFYTDLRAYELWGGLQFYKTDYLLTGIMMGITVILFYSKRLLR